MEQSSQVPFESDQEQLSQECDGKPSTFTSKQAKRPKMDSAGVETVKKPRQSALTAQPQQSGGSDMKRPKSKQRKRKRGANDGGDNSGPQASDGEDNPGPQASDGEDNSGPQALNGASLVKNYLLSLSNAMASLQLSPENTKELKAMKKKTGADVQIHVLKENLKFANIRGEPSQIEKAARYLAEKSRHQGSIDAQKYWLQWVQEAFPDIDSRSYFLPSVYVKKFPITTTKLTAGNSVQVIEKERIQKSDAKGQAATERVFLCLKKFFEPNERNMSKENQEILVGITELDFKDYLRYHDNEAAHLPRPDTRGEIDVLLIHKRYGFIICEVKSVDNVHKDNRSTDAIKRKLEKAVDQLNLAKDTLSKLVSDVAPGLRITNTIAVPNLRSEELWKAIRGDDKLQKALCDCLGASKPADIPGLCLCSEQLSDPKTPWNVSDSVLCELGQWWDRIVAGKLHGSTMNSIIYKILTARFCGPATTVTVPFTSPPSLCVKTLGQAVSWTGECYTAQITLFPEQVDLVNMKDPKVFLTGPPGTGKTVLLQLKGTEWLKSGHKVYIVSTGNWSRASCYMLKHLLNSAKEKYALPGQVQLQLYDFTDKTRVKTAVTELTREAEEGPLYVIADEAGPDKKGKESRFKTFCCDLLKDVPNLHLWAASCYWRQAPSSWKLEHLTRPLRFPPSIVREVQEDRALTQDKSVRPYSERGVPDFTDGPEVKRLSHRGHGGRRPADCFKCGEAVANFLKSSLRVGESDDDKTGPSTSQATASLSLKWKDVLVLTRDQFHDDTGIVSAVREAGIPVQVVKNEKDIEDLATAGKEDVVWVVKGEDVRGLERKVVVCLELIDPVKDKHARLRGYNRLHYMSRCSSQLVIVYN